MSTQSTNTSTPTLARLNEGRKARWHQNGEALLTFENLRSWLNTAGMVLFAPRPQIPVPAPTMVEAVLGAAAAEPTLAQMDEARALLARAIAEGIAVPLNLLGAAAGTAGETPDYVVAAGVFPYIFTLKGDKAWKQAPSTTGSAKVSPLAANTYEALTKSGPRSAYDLATELGNAVTEGAVLRALNELWSHLRVFPLPQTDGTATLWELASARLTKQIKTGANAGVPTALSTLASLYLGQVGVATEDEVETFLSPLSPRSKVRDVLHALTAARQLDTVAIEGKTMLHVSGEDIAYLFPAAEAAPELIEVAAAAADTEETGAPEAEGVEADSEAAAEGRIKKYVPKPRKAGTGYLAKPKTTRAARPTSDRGERPFRPGSGADMPVHKPRAATAAEGETPRFDKPWEEDRPARAEGRAARPTRPRRISPDTERPGSDVERPVKARFERPGFDRPEGGAGPRRDGGARAEGDRGGWKPAFRAGDSRTGGSSSFRRDDAPRWQAKPGGGADGAPRGARPAREGSTWKDRGARPGGGFKSAGGFKPAGGARPFRSDRPAPGDRPTWKDRPARGERPAGGFKPAGGSRPPFRGDRAAGGFKPAGARPAWGDRAAGGSRPGGGFKPAGGYKPAGGAKNFRGEPMGGGYKSAGGGFKPAGARPAWGGRPAGADGARRPGGPRRSGPPQGEREGGRPPFRRFDAAGPGKRPFVKRSGPGSEGGARGGRPGGASFGKKPGFAAKRPFTGKAAGRTFKRKEDESA